MHFSLHPLIIFSFFLHPFSFILSTPIFFINHFGLSIYLILTIKFLFFSFHFLSYDSDFLTHLLHWFGTFFLFLTFKIDVMIQWMHEFYLLKSCRGHYIFRLHQFWVGLILKSLILFHCLFLEVDFEINHLEHLIIPFMIIKEISTISFQLQ